MAVPPPYTQNQCELLPGPNNTHGVWAASVVTTSVAYTIYTLNGHTTYNHAYVVPQCVGTCAACTCDPSIVYVRALGTMFPTMFENQCDNSSGNVWQEMTFPSQAGCPPCGICACPPGQATFRQCIGTTQKAWTSLIDNSTMPATFSSPQCGSCAITTPCGPSCIIDDSQCGPSQMAQPPLFQAGPPPDMCAQLCGTCVGCLNAGDVCGTNPFVPAFGQNGTCVRFNQGGLISLSCVPPTTPSTTPTATQPTTTTTSGSTVTTTLGSTNNVDTTPTTPTTATTAMSGVASASSATATTTNVGTTANALATSSDVVGTAAVTSKSKAPTTGATNATTGTTGITSVSSAAVLSAGVVASGADHAVLCVLLPLCGFIMSIL